MSHKTIKLVVEQDQSDRLDKFLAAHIPDITRSKVQSLIKDGNVYLSGKQMHDTSYKVKLLDEIEVHVPLSKPMSVSPKEMDLDIIYEDTHLAVINKSAGVTTHPGAGNYEDTLVNGLLAHFKGELSSIGGEIRPGIVHRLDKNTSGLIIIAKDDTTHAKLSEQMQARGIKRIYQTIVWGAPVKMSGTIQTNIGRNKKDRKKMGVLEFGGKVAITHYKVLEVFLDGAFSLLECELGTGRTHQIRVHLTHIGHPVVGDPDYGNVRANRKVKIPMSILEQINGIDKQMLHAKKLQFLHPITQDYVEYEIDLPHDMRELIFKMRAASSS